MSFDSNPLKLLIYSFVNRVTEYVSSTKKKIIEMFVITTWNQSQKETLYVHSVSPS